MKWIILLFNVNPMEYCHLLNSERPSGGENNSGYSQGLLYSHWFYLDSNYKY